MWKNRRSWTSSVGVNMTKKRLAYHRRDIDEIDERSSGRSSTAFPSNIRIYDVSEIKPVLIVPEPAAGGRPGRTSGISQLCIRM
jgi:hypothetical protein